MFPACPIRERCIGWGSDSHPYTRCEAEASNCDRCGLLRHNARVHHSTNLTLRGKLIKWHPEELNHFLAPAPTWPGSIIPWVYCSKEPGSGVQVISEAQGTKCRTVVLVNREAMKMRKAEVFQDPTCIPVESLPWRILSNWYKLWCIATSVWLFNILVTVTNPRPERVYLVYLTVMIRDRQCKYVSAVFSRSQVWVAATIFSAFILVNYSNVFSNVILC